MIKNWFRRTFGKKFGLLDLSVLLVILGYPVYLYFNAMYDFLIINKGIDAIVTDLGGYIYGALVTVYFISIVISKVRK